MLTRFKVHLSQIAASQQYAEQRGEDIENIQNVFGIQVDAAPELFCIGNDCWEASAKRGEHSCQPNEPVPKKSRRMAKQNVRVATRVLEESLQLEVHESTSINFNDSRLQPYIKLAPVTPPNVPAQLQSPASPKPSSLHSVFVDSGEPEPARHANHFKRDPIPRRRPMKLDIPTWGQYIRNGFDDRLFSKLCQLSLSNACDNENCPHPHELPPGNELLRVLRELPLERVLATYNAIVCRCDQLIRAYFATFAQYFALNNQLVQLHGMIEVIEHPMRPMYQFYYHIVQAYCLTGLKFTHALKVLLQKRQVHNQASNRYMVMLILETSKCDFMEIVDELRAIIVINDCRLDIQVMRNIIMVGCELQSPKLITIIWEALRKNRGMVSMLKNDRYFQKLRKLTVRLFGHSD